MTKFEKFTSDVVCILEYATEILAAYHVYRLTDSILLGILSVIMLSVAYSASILMSSSMSCFDIEKAKDKVIELQPYWLVMNSVICIGLSWLD